MNRHRRAIKTTSILAVLIMIPMSYRLWLEFGSEYSNSHKELGSVQSFVYRDSKDLPLTKESLIRSVTIVLNIPKGISPSDINIVKTNITYISDWVSKNLILTNPEEKNPLNLIVAGDDLGLTTPNWRHINAVLESGTLLPNGFSSSEPWVVLIDPNLDFASAWSLKSELPSRSLEKVFSRTTFEQYLGNYLARRTFMGPKRE